MKIKFFKIVFIISTIVNINFNVVYGKVARDGVTDSDVKDVDKIIENYFSKLDGYDFFHDGKLDEYSLINNPVNKLYAIRLLLNHPKKYKNGIHHLNRLARNNAYSPSAMRNIKDANAILRSFHLTSTDWWFSQITVSGKVIERRAFTIAQYFLNEAIMNTR